MRALLTHVGGDLRRRRLQTIVVVLIVGLAAGIGTVATLLLAEAGSPYTTAFRQYHGAHLIVYFQGTRVTPAQLAATTHLPEVSASGGPWPIADLPLEYGTQKIVVQVTARADPGGPVDDLPLTSGRWVSNAGEIVLTHSFAELIGASVGSHIKVLGQTRLVELVVVGEVADIDEGDASGFNPQYAWVEPQEFPLLVVPGDRPAELVVYRFQHVATDAQLQQGSRDIAAIVPPGAEVNSFTYQEIENIFNLNSTLTLTFLLAFAVFALGASALIVANVVSGAVLTSRRDIGIVKALGFTPGQVVASFVAQMLAAALVGCLIAVPLGALASHPLVSASADALGLPAPSQLDLRPLLLVTFCSLLVVAAAATIPALRAGLLRPIEAITPGASPGTGRRSWIGTVVSWLHLPRPVTLGASDAFARPVRGILTTIAVMIGVTTLVFAFGLNATFQSITGVRAFGTAADITIARFGNYPDASLMRTLQSEPATKQVIANDFTHLTLPGAGSAPVTTLAFRGDSAALEYPLVAGRWYQRAGEVVLGSAVASQANLHVGQSFTAILAGHSIQLRLVGIYFTFDNFGREAQIDWSTFLEVDPTAQPAEYLVDLQPGANAAAYSAQVEATAPDYLSVSTGTAGPAAATISILNEVLIVLVAILIAIAVAGVFNTLLLHIRERTRDTATLKALGMTPGQVVTMVVSSAGVLGLLGAVLGLPAGIWLHQWLLDVMSAAVGGGEMLPRQFTQGVYTLLILPLPALAGIVIAVVGAALPAWLASRTPPATILHAE